MKFFHQNGYRFLSTTIVLRRVVGIVECSRLILHVMILLDS
nr:MAG TPA: hypothetical protein [Caudoviricetes sp.]